MPRPGSRRSGFVPPELATLVEEAPAGEGWLHEPKFDGYRLECLVDAGRVRLLTRRGLDWTSRFPAIAKAVAAVPVRQAVFDGEAVALLPDGRSSFQALQQALGADPPGPTVCFIFDLLSLEGEDLRRLPLIERKKRLAALLTRRRKGTLRYTEHTIADGPGAFRKACSAGLEGIISKRKDRPYQSGRTRDWLKTKCTNRQEFVIVGYTDPRGSRRDVGALLLGVRDRPAGPLRFAGKVGTGMDQAMLRTLGKALAPLRRDTAPVPGPLPFGRNGVHWVEPRLVAEVSFTEWTGDGRLRHPSFMGLREDKSSREVRREEPMSIAGISLTHADRVLYPGQGLTKQDLAAYYEAIAPWMLPHVAGRPLSLVRCPSGQQKACFYQKHWSGTLPPAIATVEIKEGSGAMGAYTVVHDAAGLVSLIQFGVLELHLWGAREDDVEHPDRIIFDLDPAPEVPWAQVRQAAERLRDLLGGLGLETWLKTTGGKGLHVALPIERRSTWSEVSGFARAVAYHLAEQEPERYLARASKAERKGRIFVDWLRNSRGATAIAPWSTRARAGAPISAPIPWEQLGKLKGGDQYTVENAHALATRLGTDPWAALLKTRQRITPAMIGKLDRSATPRSSRRPAGSAPRR